MNILYIGTPYSIHDIKWMSFFSQKDEYNVYMLSEKKDQSDYEKDRSVLADLNIELLPQIDSFRFSTPIKTVKSILVLRKAIQELKIDCVQIFFSAPYALWALFINVPVIITNRGSDVLKVIPALQDSGFKNRLFFSLFKKAFQRSLITSTSSLQNEKVKEMFGISETHLIRTGVNVDEISSVNQEKNDIVFSPRYFAPIYDIALQIEAIKHLPKTIREKYVFVFIQGEKYKSRYATTIKKKLLDLQKEQIANIKIIDQMSQLEIWKMYAQSSLTIMTPISDGTPNSALEAMSARCPLIVSDLAYDKELFEETCLKLKERTAPSLARQIEEAITSYPEDYLSRAFNNVSVHGNRKIEMAKLEKIYQDILSI